VSVIQNRLASLGREARASGRCGCLLNNANFGDDTVSVIQNRLASLGREARASGRCGCLLNNANFGDDTVNLDFELDERRNI